MSKLKEIVAEAFEVKPGDVTDDKQLKDFEMWDSMTHMLLISSIEGAFEVELTNDEIVNMQSIADIKKILKDHGIEPE